MEETLKNLIIKIDYTEPIPIDVFKKHLDGLNNQFKKFSNNKNDTLVIKEIKEGCIEIILDAIRNNVIPYIQDFNTVAEFVGFIGCIIYFFSNKNKNKPELDKKGIQDYKNITQIANYGSMTINNNYELKKEEMPVVENNMNKYIKELEQIENEEKIYENVLLRLIQIKDDSNNTNNTKGIIEEISAKQVAVVFTGDIKKQIMETDSNPFRFKYLVNVKHNVKENHYIILNLFDKSIIKKP